MKIDHQFDDVIKDWIWCSRSLQSPKLCDVCRNRAGKTKTEIKELNDGYPLDPPLHNDCACTWLPKVKTWEELLPPSVKPLKSPSLVPPLSTKGSSLSFKALTSEQEEKLKEDLNRFIKEINHENVQVPDIPVTPLENENSILGEVSTVDDLNSYRESGFLVLTNHRLIFKTNAQVKIFSLDKVGSLTIWEDWFQIKIKKSTDSFLFSVKNPVLWRFFIQGIVKGEIKAFSPKG